MNPSVHCTISSSKTGSGALRFFKYSPHPLAPTPMPTTPSPGGAAIAASVISMRLTIPAASVFMVFIPFLKATGGGCKPVRGQVGDLSTKGAAPTTGVFTTGRYRFYIAARPFMREGATIYAWTTIPGATIYAWTTSIIHGFLWTSHGLPFLLMWVRDGLTIRPSSVVSTCTCP